MSASCCRPAICRNPRAVVWFEVPSKPVRDLEHPRLGAATTSGVARQLGCLSSSALCLFSHERQHSHGDIFYRHRALFYDAAQLLPQCVMLSWLVDRIKILQHLQSALQLSKCRPKALIFGRCWKSRISYTPREVNEEAQTIFSFFTGVGESRWVEQPFQINCSKPEVLKFQCRFEPFNSISLSLRFLKLTEWEKHGEKCHTCCNPSAGRGPGIPVDLARGPQRPAAEKRPFQYFHFIPLCPEAILP